MSCYRWLACSCYMIVRHITWHLCYPVFEFSTILSWVSLFVSCVLFCVYVHTITCICTKHYHRMLNFCLQNLKLLHPWVINYIGEVIMLYIMLEQLVQGFTAIELKMALRGIVRLIECTLSSISWAHHTRYVIGNLSHFRFKLTRSCSFLVTVYSGLFLFQRKSNLVVGKVNKSPFRRYGIKIGNHGLLSWGSWFQSPT